MSATTVCPECHAPLAPDPADPARLICICRPPIAAATSDATPSDPSDDAGRRGVFGHLLYGLSLPERIVRGAVGLTAGAARELAEVLVPEAFQSSASYRIAIENSLGFLTGAIGGVPAADAAGGSDDAAATVARKAVGNFVDLAGLALLHVSPMWLLAVVSDIAYGTQTYTQELARELQKQGVIDDASTIHHVDDVLAALRKTFDSAADKFDRPPLSMDELKASLDEMRSSLVEADPRKIIPESELNRVWSEMQQIASQDNVSLLGVSGAIAMQAFDRAKTAGMTTWIGLNVAGGVLSRNVFSHYGEAVRRIQQQGFFESVRASYGPYLTAVWNNFSPRKKSWTEHLLDPAQAARLFSRAGGILWGDTAETSPPPG